MIISAAIRKIASFEASNSISFTAVFIVSLILSIIILFFSVDAIATTFVFSI